MSTRSGTICVFAKAPRPGATKTRLAKAIGPAQAAELARAFLIDTWQTVAEVRRASGARVVLVLDGRADDLPRLDPVPEIIQQGLGDLGARLERALRAELERGAWALAIGTDSPTLPAELIAHACQRLAAGAQAVLGPCDDGGFYALGLSTCPPGLLAELPWSSDVTLSATQGRLAHYGIAVERLEGWYDVDQLADLERLREELATTEAAVRAPQTARAVRGIEPELSVIIPVLDEQARIGQRLRELQPLAEQGHAEIIVADGGSRDRTLDIVQGLRAARIVQAPRGRAVQMNAGARAARGRVLLFLHADVALPDDVATWVRRTLADQATVAGAFRTWTVADDGSDRWAPWLHLADVRSRYTRLPYGDQALFVRREVFFDVGGFPELPLMEDVELARRLRRRGNIRIVAARVRVSGRRFLAHPLRDTLFVNVFPLLYRLGVDARVLAKLYRNVR